jgi:hypothetical protein
MPPVISGLWPAHVTDRAVLAVEGQVQMELIVACSAASRATTLFPPPGILAKAAIEDTVALIGSARIEMTMLQMHP